MDSIVPGASGLWRVTDLSHSLSAFRPGEQRWRLTVTALTSESITDYLQLHAADGLMTITIFIQRDPPPGNEPPEATTVTLNHVSYTLPLASIIKTARRNVSEAARLTQ